MNRAGLLLIAAVAAAGAHAEPSFDDVGPIFARRCAVCHHPNGIGPFSLLTYQDAKRRAGMIKEVVTERRMPPWHADPAHGVFKNDRRLSDAEVSSVAAWVDAGAPPGSTADFAVASESGVGEWRIGTPDIVYAMPKIVELPAAVLVPYENFEIPSGFDKDTWIRAIEVKPGNPKVVHHIVITLKVPGGYSVPHGEFIGLGYGMIAGYTPGMDPTILEPDTALLVPRGSIFQVQIHYTTTGRPERDRSRFGCVLADTPPGHRAYWAIAVNIDFAIPPYADNYRVDASRVVPRDLLLHALNAHMHYRGKSFEFVATYPDGTVETLLRVPKYDFNWQTEYILAQPKRLPKGTRIDAIAHYDNSANNPANPDPTVTVRHGEQTWNEMLAGGMLITWADEPEEE